MKNSIVVRADASVNHKKGVGIAYESVVFDSDGTYSIYSDADYIPKQIKTTEAETLAAAFGLKEIFYKVDNPEKYELTIKSDCEHTVRVINEKIDSDVERVIAFFADQFKSLEPENIPRDENERADALAREKLRSGYEEQNAR